MLQIENHKLGFMSESGSSVLHVMHSSISILDMLVREAIQNSFDARISSSNIIEKINCGHFNKSELSKKFELIEDKLLALDDNKNHFISFSDFNTSGLTGPVKIDDIDRNDWGKFLNLVRNVGKTNKHTEAGGSWGYGKTVFYRAGIGLVIYYTRIAIDKNYYEERLMACMVENEKNENGILNDVQKDQNTGIAWWGKKENDILVPITDHDEIVSILSCFNLTAYSGTETGTRVIIPFIDDENLLNQTMVSNVGDEDVASWCTDLETYLDIAFQRWYPTRYSNKLLGTNYIDVYINEEKKEPNDMYPLFKVIQQLYNYGINNKNEPDFNAPSFSIDVYKTPLNDKSVGMFYYALLSREELYMEVPNLYPSPFSQINNELNEPEKENKVIICFCRKPGMILKYDVDEAWSAGIETPDKDKYLIGLFLPNSKNYVSIDGRRIYVEEYLRSSERAEHNDWNDIPEYIFDDGYKIKTSHFKFVEKIQKRIRTKILGLSSNVNEQPPENFYGSVLAKKFADLFLPQLGFGHLPHVVPKGGGDSPKPRIKSVRKTKINFKDLEIDINENFTKEFEILVSKNDLKFGIEFNILTENGEISANEWENSLKFPLKIIDLEINNILDVNDKTITYDKNDKLNGVSITKKYTNNYKSWFGITFDINENISRITGKIIYKCLDSSVLTCISRSKEEK